MTFAEALAELIRHGVVIPGKNFRSRLMRKPADFNGTFTRIGAMTQLVFETTLPNGKTSYLRRDHYDKHSIVFGDTL